MPVDGHRALRARRRREAHAHVPLLRARPVVDRYRLDALERQRNDLDRDLRVAGRCLKRHAGQALDDRVRRDLADEEREELK